MAPGLLHDGFLARASFIVTSLCIGAVAVTLLILAIPALRVRVVGSPAPGTYTVGDLIDVKSVAYASTRRTVLLFSRSSCSACQASKSVMAGIAADMKGLDGARVVMVVGASDSEEDRAFAADIGLDSDHVIPSDMTRLRLRYVPALIVTDQSGRILLSKEGLLTESDRADVVRRVTN